MTTKFNEVFKQLLIKYNLPEDLAFCVDLPIEIRNILTDQILISELGITLKSFNRLYKATKGYENQSRIEDSENHFHVDWFIEPADDKKAFMLGIHTLTLLAEKFQKEKISGIRFWYSFQTSELGQHWAKQNNISEEEEDHFISDRLSFYKRREGEDIVSADEKENEFWAMLTIDI